MDIDVTLNLAAGYRKPKRHDADKDSPILRRYHQALWSKELPSGIMFTLDASGPKSRYLIHDSEQLGRFRLASDAITTRMNNGARRLIAKIPDAQLPPHAGYTIGSSIIFPGNQVDGHRTINGERGCNRKIDDRFDLTLECIRRFYLGEDSPLYDTLTRYDRFFALFEDFDGYVSFFLLDDLVGTDGRVRFWLPFEEFHGVGRPKDVESYLAFRYATLDFISARNRRIKAWADEHLIV